MPITTCDQMSALLQELRRRRPFLFGLAADRNVSLTIGLAKDMGSVQIASSNGDPPYLEAVNPESPPLTSDERDDPYGGAVRADDRLGIVSTEFMCGGNATPIPSRYIIPFELVKKIIMHFLNTGQALPDVAWDEI